VHLWQHSEVGVHLHRPMCWARQRCAAPAHNVPHHDAALHISADTAGIRETGDVVERLGVARSREAAAAADIVVMVVDAQVVHSEVAVACLSQLLAIAS
jgi:GTPase Era involved in 16S rRNA processing